MSKFFAPKESVILNGTGYAAGKAYKITESILPSVLRLMDEGRVFLYENPPDFAREPIYPKPAVYTPETKLGKVHKREKPVAVVKEKKEADATGEETDL